MLCVGCATARVEKMSFDEAFEADASRRSPHRATAKKRKTAKPPATFARSPHESKELQAALAGFAESARQQRTKAKPGAPMPPEQAANWSVLLDAVDAFLSRAPEKTASIDVIRARAAAEAELELDARTYGDFPEDVAERVLGSITRLGLRMAQLRPRKRAAEVRMSFEWPVEPVTITSLYGRRLHPVTRTVKQHTGVDLDAYAGQLVTSAAHGQIIRAGWNGAHGVQVEIQHAGGVITRYSHLASALVEKGAVVQKGDPIGLAGTSGLSTGIHLHFELWRDGKPRDPLEELADPTRSPAVAGAPNI